MGFPYELRFIYGTSICKPYHIYSSQLALSLVYQNRRNMMSVAYDFAHSPATEFMSRPQHLLIDGRRVPASSGRTFKSLNPATGQVIAIVAEGGEADVEHAVAAARRAFEGPWRTMRPSE